MMLPAFHNGCTLPRCQPGLFFAVQLAVSLNSARPHLQSLAVRIHDVDPESFDIDLSPFLPRPAAKLGPRAELPLAVLPGARQAASSP